MKKAFQKCIAAFLAAVLAAGLSSCAKDAAETAPAEEEGSAVPAMTLYSVKSVLLSKGNRSIRVWDERNGELLAFSSEKIGEDIPEELLEDPEYIHDGSYDV